MKKVFVGLSGGVDSSVTAALLKQQGYEVVGAYMKNWSQNIGSFTCPWQEDFQDAKRVAVKLGIDFKVYDFQTEYKQKVVDYMIDEFKAGRTPNPDIMCNQEIKFKLFFDTAIGEGANFVATGHYARTKNGQLLKAKDDNKDQTYFLYRVSEAALKQTLFPIGDYTKPEVRALAKKFGLATATKKDSQGICFVGKVGIKEFLQNFVTTKPGKIVDQAGNTIGEHDGAIFYTIGQRHGLDVGGGLPYYVTGKDMASNEVFVTTDLDDTNLWSQEINLIDVHWINKNSRQFTADSGQLQARTRHRASLIDCTVESNTNNTLLVKCSEQVRAITPGQSVVIYDGDICLGGGIVV